MFDLFFLTNDIEFASYADENTLLFVGTDIDDIKSKLKNAKEALLQWINHSQKKTEPGKCQFICSSNVYNNMQNY